MNKIVKIAHEDLKYLKTMVSSELEKFDDVVKTTKDPEIREERKILSNLNRQLSV